MLTSVSVKTVVFRLNLGCFRFVTRAIPTISYHVLSLLAYLRKKITEAANHESLAEARRQRRQRKLDALEIPDDQVEVSDELLGRGGFGEVFIARVYERNAAAKVLDIRVHRCRLSCCWHLFMFYYSAPDLPDGLPGSRDIHYHSLLFHHVSI